MTHWENFMNAEIRDQLSKRAAHDVIGSGKNINNTSHAKSLGSLKFIVHVGRCRAQFLVNISVDFLLLQNLK